MHYVPTFLRPLTRMNTGMESRVEDKAERVEVIDSNSSVVDFTQSKEVAVWRYKDALEGKTVIENERKLKVKKEVEQSNRHWWIVTDGLLDDLEPALRDHADIFDLLLAVNLCIDDPVAFSQSPGQTVGGAYRVHRGALNYRGDLTAGNIGIALATMNDIPTEVEMAGDLEEIYEIVRALRTREIETDEDMDIRRALQLYDDAIKSTYWTGLSNLYFVCENVLCSGDLGPVDRIDEVCEMDYQEADNWRIAVNRLKHPDTEDRPGLIDQPELEVPTFSYIRKTANTALLHAMRQRYSDLDV